MHSLAPPLAGFMDMFCGEEYKQLSDAIKANGLRVRGACSCLHSCRYVHALCMRTNDFSSCRVHTLMDVIYEFYRSRALPSYSTVARSN